MSREWVLSGGLESLEVRFIIVFIVDSFGDFIYKYVKFIKLA